MIISSLNIESADTNDSSKGTKCNTTKNISKNNSENYIERKLKSRPKQAFFKLLENKIPSKNINAKVIYSTRIKFNSSHNITIIMGRRIINLDVDIKFISRRI